MRPLGRTKRRRNCRKKSFEVRPVPCAHDESFVALVRWMKGDRNSIARDGIVQTMKGLELCNFHDTGRGMQALRDVKSGDKIISLPGHFLITPDTVLSSSLGSIIQKCGQGFTPQSLLALFLVVERAKGNESVWSPYINTLPKAYSIPVYFSSNEVELLTPQAKISAHKSIDRFLSAKQNIASFCRESSLHHANLICNVESLKWAWSTVETRSVYLETKPRPLLVLKPEESNVALAPFLDMLNHSDTAEVNAGLNSNTNCYEITSTTPYPKYSQVFISYGAHDNTRLVVNYGFTLPNNVNNCFIFTIGDLRNHFTSLPHWDHKEETLKESQLHKNLICDQDGVSWSLMTAVKVCALKSDELHLRKSVVLGLHISQENTHLAYRMVEDLVTSHLIQAQKHLHYVDGQPQSTHKDLIRAVAVDDVNILEKSLELLQVR